MANTAGKCVLCGKPTGSRLVTCTEEEYKSVRKKHSTVEVPMSAFICSACIDKIAQERDKKGGA